jgi:HD-GYP domain-containing protein (c-di-GMP phosphodiesterase class II)
MFPMKTDPVDHRRQPTATDRASALAIVLREEFDTLFVFYDASSGAGIPSVMDVDPERCAQADRLLSSPPTAATINEIAAEGRARATLLPGGRYQLALLFYAGSQPAFVAIGEIVSLARTAEEMRQEQTRLRKWLQSVSDRSRLTDQLAVARRLESPPAPASAPNTIPWEALLTLDQLLRRGRIHKDREKNHRRVLEAAFGFVRAETLVWVPRDSNSDVVIQGEAFLAADDFRQLAALLGKIDDTRLVSPRLYDQFQEKPGASRFPRASNLIAFPVNDQSLLGWVLAINKRSDKRKDAGVGPVFQPFRKSDAALLAPFVAMLESCERAANRYQELKELLVGLTRALTTAIDAKDAYTYGHSERVGRIAVELGRELGMEGDDLGDLYLVGLLHDVGKIGIRDEVLRKPGKLTEEEQAHIQQHVTIGYTILADLRQIRSLLPGVRSHHERYDGAGYPDGLAGENIPLLARIIAVADAYDAMTTNRPYRNSLPMTKVEHILTEGAGSQWDKRIIEAFLRCRDHIHSIRQRGVGESLRFAIEGALRSGSDSFRSSLGATDVKG